jgi:hypothetical protein
VVEPLGFDRVTTFCPVKHNVSTNARGSFSLPTPWFDPENTTRTKANFDVGDNNLEFDTAGAAGFVSTDPGSTLNFALRPGSPMYKLGWKTIPQDEIGPDTDTS